MTGEEVAFLVQGQLDKLKELIPKVAKMEQELAELKAQIKEKDKTIAKLSSTPRPKTRKMTREEYDNRTQAWEEEDYERR